jgi:hypothetical protein
MKTHSEESKLKISKANSAFPLYVYNSLRQLVMICPSVISLADTINTNSSTITNSIENESLFRALPENFSKSLWLIRNFRGLDKNPGDLHRRWKRKICLILKYLFSIVLIWISKQLSLNIIPFNFLLFFNN